MSKPKKNNDARPRFKLPEPEGTIPAPAKQTDPPTSGKRFQTDLLPLGAYVAMAHPRAFTYGDRFGIDDDDDRPYWVHKGSRQYLNLPEGLEFFILDAGDYQGFYVGTRMAISELHKLEKRINDLNIDMGQTLKVV